MMEPDIEPNAARRLSLRRGRSSGGSSASFSAPGTGRVESIRETSADVDDVDSIIDPDHFDNAVRTRALAAPVTQEEARDNPRARLNEVAMAGSAAYAREYRLDLVAKLLMRNTPLDQIARQLQVSISTVEKDRAEVRRRFRAQAKDLNIDELVGGQNAMYDEISALALRMASSRDVPAAMKLASMRTALAANADRTRFLNSTGVFDVLRFRRNEGSEDLSDVQTLMAQTMEMMQNLMAEEGEEIPAPRRVIKRTRKAGGFDPMTFDDADASGSSQEVQEL